MASDKDAQQSSPDFSNVESGSSSTAPAPAETAATVKTYTVAAGDTLSKIARHQYGDANQWRKIFDANRDILDDPNLIQPGQELTIPD